MDSIRPGPLFRCTSIAAPITSLLRRSAFSYNECISERVFTEDSEGNKDWIGFEPLRSLRFLLLISFTSCFAELAGRLNGICRVDQSKPRVSNLGFCKE